jgi:DNA-binding CsgD family transcriptional regulator
MKQKCNVSEMLRQFMAGMTPREIAALHGITTNHARILLNEVRPGCVVARYNERVSAARNNRTTEQIALRILRGDSIQAIADELGMSRGAVWHIGRRNGMRKKCEEKHQRALKLAKLQAEGRSRRSLAAEFGMSMFGVSAAIRRVKSTHLQLDVDSRYSRPTLENASRCDVSENWCQSVGVEGSRFGNRIGRCHEGTPK